MRPEATGSPGGPPQPIGDLDDVHAKVSPEVLEKLSQAGPAL